MKVSRSALLPYSTRQMYDIVADIPAYPSFLNWCKSVEIISEQGDEVVAKLKISSGQLDIQFTTRNLNKPAESISLALVDGPFSTLVGSWRFQALNQQACKVAVDMEFNFDRKLADSVFSKVFGRLISMELDAFQKRAQQLYGKP